MMQQSPLLIKIGGNEAEDPTYLAAFAAALSQIHRPKVVVHGGGRTISALQEKMGGNPKFVNGQRYTDEETLRIVEMVLCGTANKNLVRAFLNAGQNALGISGMDAGILVCDEVLDELGHVGLPTKVRAEALVALLKAGFLPVIAPLGLNVRGQPLNVNADLAAGAIAKSLKAREVIFLTNVPGILLDGEVTPDLNVTQVNAAIASGEIRGGMIPKVAAAMSVAEQGMQVRICDLAGLESGGTKIHATIFIDRSSDFVARTAVHTPNLQA